MQGKPTEITAFTSVRGLAASWVVYHHFSNNMPISYGDYILAITRYGFLAVDVFFILSGFIMGYCYAHFFTVDALDRRKYFQFLGLRLARIYPLHIFVLALFALSFFAHHQPFGWISLLQSCLLIQSWYIVRQEWNGVAWTISIEWLCYLLFPMAIIHAMRLPKLGSCAIIVLLCVFIGLTPANNPFFWGRLCMHMVCGGFLRGGAGFLVGMLLYRLYTDKVLFAWPWKIIGNLCALSIPAVIIFVHKVAFILPLFALLIYALAHPSNARHAFWNSRFMVFLGDISYSVYMIQLLIVQEFYNLHLYWSPITAIQLASVTILFSYMAHRFIEKPCRYYIRNRWLRFDAKEALAPNAPDAKN